MNRRRRRQAYWVLEVLVTVLGLFAAAWFVAAAANREEWGERLLPALVAVAALAVVAALIRTRQRRWRRAG